MKGAVTNRRAAPSLNYNMKDINFLLKTNLRPDCVPDESLNTSVLKRAKEIENMKKLFVSVPMKGRTEEEIKASIQKMKKIAEIYEVE